jgi:hypothetical protein
MRILFSADDAGAALIAQESIRAFRQGVIITLYRLHLVTLVNDFAQPTRWNTPMKARLSARVVELTAAALADPEPSFTLHA